MVMRIRHWPHLRDMSLRHKIMTANFLMVFVPVLLIVILGTVIFAGLRFTGTLRQMELALLWPEQGAAMSVSYAVSDLRGQLESRENPHVERLREACQLLEKNGVQVVIVRDRPVAPRVGPEPGGPHVGPVREHADVQEAKVLYLSPGAEATTVVQAAVHSLGRLAMQAESGTRWQHDEFAFVHHARKGLSVYAYGRLPLPVPGQKDIEAARSRKLSEGLALGVVVLALLFIIWLGVYLARLLARQVLGPLAELRQAAEEIGRGNLDCKLEAHTHDEVGETCACFDEMRVALRAAREKQQQYEQGRRELLAGISHDLSTPMMALGGYASGLTDGIAATPERRQHYAERIQALVQQLGHLVDRLFLFSKLDLGRVEFRCEPTGLYDYMLEQVDRLRTVWTAQGVEIGFTAAEENEARTAMALLDREEFARVLDNLLSNAAKYAGEADGSIHVEFALQTTAQTVRLSCRDHGPGVPEAELAHLFESFYRVDKSRGEKPGHGLGMAIASRIVTGMQGHIWAENAAGGGLCVVVEFPRCTAEQESGPATVAAATGQRKDLGDEEHTADRG